MKYIYGVFYLIFYIVGWVTILSAFPALYQMAVRPLPLPPAIALRPLTLILASLLSICIASIALRAEDHYTKR